jgi:DNA-binding beta-propeller fold protein YncE
MSVRRVSALAVTALAAMICLSCGDVYRPVVIPINPTPPNPSGFHAVFAISSNVPFNKGAAFQIDVSGDTNIGQANMGWNPTHAAILPTNSRVFVASAGTLNVGGADVVTAFTPAANSSAGTGLGTPTTFTFPNVGPAGPDGLPTWVCSYLPDFLTTTQFNSVYVANYGVENDPACLPNGLSSTDSVAVLGLSNSAITNIAYLPGGSHPVALAETPNAQHLYVVNQGTGTVTDLSPTDLSTKATIAVGATPVWAAARNDNQRVYVLTQGDGTLVPIDVATDAVLPSPTVGAGANFVLFEPHLNRLYVTNPTTGTVDVFAATGGPQDTPVLLAAISMTAGSNPPCAVACSPVSVAALPDGSRFYVASYVTQPNCPDVNVGTSSPCMIPMLTVFDALSMLPRQPTSNLLAPSYSLPLLTSPQFSASQYAVSPVASCVPAANYAPGTTRFRMFATASADSSHVYVSICDAGVIADVRTTTSTITTGGNNAPDVLITDISAPLGTCTGANCSGVATITSYSISSGVATFTANNNFIPGTRVAISGFTGTTGSQLNGQTLTVLASQLSGTTFQCNVSVADGSGTDTGTAVPISPPQRPIYLVTGQ